MTIPYRTRRTLRRVGIGLLVVLVVAMAVWLCWVIWLERYIVYSRDGATLDFDRSVEELEGELAVEPTAGQPIGIYYNEGSDAVEISTKLERMSGYYADAAALRDMSSVRARISELPSENPVMLDVKNIKGAFFYSSAVGQTRDENIDTAAMDQLIGDLAKSNRYLIARLPGLRDWNYGLEHVDDGLFLNDGAGLWMDDDGCYWLNPEASGTMTYLMRIVTELRQLGFDEVVFTDFRFPDSDQYAFEGDTFASLTNAAQNLVSSCTTESFAVSFESSGSSFPLPEGRSRLYLENVDASAVDTAAGEVNITDPEIRLVFMADSNDTRYDVYSVMRPLSTAH